jgi:heme-degrading monooxygenase HmoA
MPVLVTLQVKPVDWPRFRAALEWLYGQEAPGWLSSTVYRLERDPAAVLVVDEWESHAAFHDFAARVGPEFNQRAGTTDSTWQVEAWVPTDAPRLRRPQP